MNLNKAYRTKLAKLSEMNEVTMTDETEIWKDIILIPYHQAAWPFHQVSNRGRIRVLPGGRVKQRIVKEIEIRKLSSDSKGYMRIKRGSDHCKVHHLVLNQFFGPCPPGQECRHLNGNPSDNRWPENIKWGTSGENRQDVEIHGTGNHPKGEHHGCAKLTESQALEILSRPYESCVKLAGEYNVSDVAIWMIRSGRTWRYLNDC